MTRSTRSFDVQTTRTALHTVAFMACLLPVAGCTMGDDSAPDWSQYHASATKAPGNSGTGGQAGSAAGGQSGNSGKGGDPSHGAAGSVGLAGRGSAPGTGGSTGGKRAQGNGKGWQRKQLRGRGEVRQRNR